MDAIVAFLRVSFAQQLSAGRTLIVFLACALLAGCQGKTIQEENPVFAAAPPRRALTNQSTLAQSPDQDTDESPIRLASNSTPELTGNTVVATVNGNPVFVDDLVGSVRLTLDAEPNLTEEQRQQILYQGVRAKLDNYVRQEVVLDALASRIPADRQDAVRASLEQPFQEVLGNIQRSRNVTSPAQLNELLAQEGLSVDLLRESFVRIQMVNGFLATLAEAPEAVDRPDMLDYYHEHIDDYKTEERVRWQEIVVLFRNHGGAEGAAEQMQLVLQELGNGTDFGEVAAKYSDSLTAERRGDLGWLEAGGGHLADKELEKLLFEIPEGEVTKVFERDDRLEVYRVRDHQLAAVTPFAEVQASIQQQLRASAQQEARAKVMGELEDKASIITIFDDEDPAASAATGP